MSGKQRNIRKRRAVDEQEELSDEEQGLSLEDTKLLQKQRLRKTGVDASRLAVPERALAAYAAEEAAAAAAGEGEGEEEEGPDVLEAAFKRERQQTGDEEDPHMRRYIEEQLAKRLGRDQGAGDAAAPAAAAPGEDGALLPMKQRAIDTELGPSWVSGILEVPLSMEQRLKNIEDTEAAKKKMLLKAGGTGRGGYGDDAEREAALRRGMFPVHFGKTDERETERIARAQEKKQRIKAAALDKKLKKKSEFKGFG